MERVNELNQRLAQIQDELLGLAPDDFAKKHALHSERDSLRAEAADYGKDRDVTRPSADMIAELKALRAQLAAVRAGYVDAVGQAGAGEAGAWNGPADTIALNAGIDRAQGVERIVHRIARLETILKERGHL